jgi:LacI family transcriptional regulator
MYRVAFWVETSHAVGRSLLRGALRYARLHGFWSFELLPADVEDVLPAMSTWRGTGVIARVWTREMERAVLKTKLPIIGVPLSNRQRQKKHPLSRVPEVVGNQAEIARIGAEHLMRNGYVNFAYVGDMNTFDWARERGEIFEYYVNKQNKRCHSYWCPAAESKNWDREQQHLRQWLRKLPKPIGILGADDVRGRQIIEACRIAGIRVPEEVGVLGIGNDELQCELTEPPLSSIALNTEMAGYRAAQALHHLMDGGVSKHVVIAIEPLEVVQRRSTEYHCSSDTGIAKAIRYIRTHALRPIQVAEVANHVGYSRRSLEQRFRKFTGRTLLVEIHNARIEKARNYLLETHMTVAEITKKMGFSSSSYFARFCERHLGLSPNRWRRKYGGLNVWP